MCNAEAVLFEWRSIEEKSLNTLLLCSSHSKLTACLLIVEHTWNDIHFRMSYNWNLISKKKKLFYKLTYEKKMNKCDSFSGTTHLLLRDPQTLENFERDSVTSRPLAYEAHVITVTLLLQ